MHIPFIDSETFENKNYTINSLPKGEYDNCTFVNCNFSDADVSNIQFLEGEFIDCNFSNSNVKHSTFKEVEFVNCKLLGVQFQDCNDFLLSFNFTECQLNLASFYQLKIKGTVFKDCNLQQADFTETDLSSSVFDSCDLSNGIFEQTKLENVDFTTASNFSIHPEHNNIKQAKFSKENVVGLLRNYDINIE